MRFLTRKTRPAEATPLRGEVLSLESLEDRAKTLAGAFTLARNSRAGRHHVLVRLDENLTFLRRAYRILADDVHRGDVVDPAVEWLLDNFHLLETQARAVRHDLPFRYYRKLPKLATREFAGMARIYAMALELIRHGDGRLDSERLTRFILAYQTIAPLTLGELWAWPIMLKLSLLENVKILTEGILRARVARRAADAALDESEAGTRSRPLPSPLHSAFVAQLRQRMLEHDPRVLSLYAQVEEALGERATTSEDVVRSEYQRQATDQASMGNTVTSLRLCEMLDWSRFVERVSPVEQVLRRDPSGDYTRMDFHSRDRYRHAVEELADSTGEAQVRVSLRAVESAREAIARDPHDRAAHVGHHLIGRGRAGLEIDVAYHPSVLTRFQRFLFRQAASAYLGSIGLLTALATFAAATYAHAVDAPDLVTAAVLLVLLPASELAVQLVQRSVAALVQPRRLPRLDFEAGVPESARTMVIVPTLLGSVAGVERLLEHLEVQALGNLDPSIHFAILSDFRDAPALVMAGDDAILAAARAGIEALNRRHASARFYLFHRDRQWNPKEGVFMGWERKRGKIEEFNRLLRGASDTSFTVCVGDLAVLPSVRNVLPREHILRTCLEQTSALAHYDFVLADCPPSISLVVVNALAASHWFLVPCSAEFLPMVGLTLLGNSIRKIQKIAPDLRLLGVVLTRYAKNERVCRQVESLLRRDLGGSLFESIIRVNTKAKSAPGVQRTIFEYEADPQGRGTVDFTGLAEEFLRRLESLTEAPREELVVHG